MLRLNQPERDYLNHACDLLETAGLADKDRFPLAFMAIQRWRIHGIPDLLVRLIKLNRGLLHRAETLVASDPFLPYPNQDDARKLSGEFVVGTINSFGDTLGLKEKDFRRGLVLYGSPETGKSHLVCGLADHALSVPPERRDYTCLFIQKKKDDIGAFAAKYPWLKVVDLGDLPYNLFQPWDGEDLKRRFLAAINTFSYENYLGTLSVPVLTYAVFTAAEEMGVFEGSGKYPVFSDLIEYSHRYLSENKIKGFNMTDTVGRLVNRLSHFSRFSWFNVREGVTADWFLSNDVCLNVADLDDSVSRTILMGILDDVHRYVIENPPSCDLRQLVFVDEARHLFDVSKEYQQFDANRNIENWFTQNRSGNIGKVLSTQEPSSMPGFAKSNSAFKAMFPLSGEGLVSAGQALNLSDEQTDHVLKLAPLGECVFRHPSHHAPFVVKVKADSGIPQGITPRAVRELMRPYLDELHDRYRPVVPDDGDDARDADGNDASGTRFPSRLSAVEVRVLSELAKNPFLRKCDLEKIIGGQAAFESAESSLISLGLVLKMKISGKTNQAYHYPLTPAGQDVLRIPKVSRISPDRFEHALFCYRVYSYLRKSGAEANREYSRDGVSGRIDVYCPSSNTAYEVQFNNKNILLNAQKCLDGFGCSKLFFVGRRKAQWKSMEKLFWSTVPPDKLEDWLKKIEFSSIQDFL